MNVLKTSFVCYVMNVLKTSFVCYECLKNVFCALWLFKDVFWMVWMTQKRLLYIMISQRCLLNGINDSKMSFECYECFKDVFCMLCYECLKDVICMLWMSQKRLLCIMIVQRCLLNGINDLRRLLYVMNTSQRCLLNVMNVSKTSFVHYDFSKMSFEWYKWLKDVFWMLWMF